MSKLLRFSDLAKREIFNNRTTLGRAIEKYGFPPGKLLTPKCRVWTAEEVESWLSTRPVKMEAEAA